MDPEKHPTALSTLTYALNSIITFSWSQPEKAMESLFFAIGARWFGLSHSRIEEYSKLVLREDIAEEEAHNYLAMHPYILEPFYSQIWSKERLGEALIADFVIRLIDNSYLVVEIEKPSDMIMTKSGNLSAKTTHAVRQALEYREWLLTNLLYSKQRFPELWRPACLVVIGQESHLNMLQQERLRQENESRQGILRIVGYDTLRDRAKAVISNLFNADTR